ncbi:MAG TPA: methyltransferase domain-containing protein [Rudaea sp.]|nr:methyltransferase domain-containing protein [Rudaea sp.]
MNQAPHADAMLTRLRAIEADIRAGRFDAAVAAINAGIAATPRDPRLYLTAAMLANALGKPGREIEALEHAVGAAPAWAPAYIELAKALSRQGRHVQALEIVARAVELAPRDLVILEAAVGVANAAGDLSAAERNLRAAAELRPRDRTIVRALAICLDKQHRYAQAEPLWRELVVDAPNDVDALANLGNCLHALGRKDEACAALERAVAMAPHYPALAFHLAIARGETPATQPLGLVEELFDEYAGRFDTHLVGRLKYRVPKRVAAMIREHHPALDISVLDLGCGTGLLGACLGPIGGAFVGVDLSEKMLHQAIPHNVYSKLRKNELHAELGETRDGSFDYVVANDVLIYLGDLGRMIPESFRVLRDGGALIFTCETAENGESFVLQPSRRYAHAPSYAERLCRDAGFVDIALEHLELRLDRDGVVQGFIVIAHKPNR